MVKAISPAIRLLSSTTRKEISFQGKTAIITGAGGALGKAYARDLAWRGCNLLLNDLGGALSGEDTKATKANGKHFSTPSCVV